MNTKKESIQRNTRKYIDMILEALTERFGTLSEENDHGEDKSGTAIAGDSILHDCRVRFLKMDCSRRHGDNS